MSEKTTVSTGGIGLGGLIFGIFLTLKILVITGVLPAAKFVWLTWFWVFFPLWIGLAVTLAIIIIVGIIVYLYNK